MAAEREKVEPMFREQYKEEDVYEVERIIDMRVEEGEVLYRVHWKNYCSDDDTWEPEARLVDCYEVLLAFKKSMAEMKAKESVKVLPTKSDVFDADGEKEESESESPLKEKKKKKVQEPEEESPPKKRKKKKDKRKEAAAPPEDAVSDGPSESPMDEAASADASTKSSLSLSITVAGSIKPKEEEVAKEVTLGQKEAAGSANMSEKFPLNCEAKDRVPRRQPADLQPADKTGSKPSKRRSTLRQPVEMVSAPAGASRPTRTPSTRRRTRASSPAATATCSSVSLSSPSEDDSDSVSDREWEMPQQADSSSDSDVSSTEPEIPNGTAAESDKWLSKNGLISWERTEAETLRYTPAACLPEGPTPYALRRIRDIQSCMKLLVTDDIIQTVLAYTNLHGQRTYGDGWGDITVTELTAFFGLLILAGVYRSRDESTRSLWSDCTGRAIFPATMTRKKFEKIAAVIRFDDKLTRPKRLKESKLAAIQPVWEKWAPRLQLLFNPGVDICVDEQLVPFKGHCSFREYIPNKPDRYGIKVWVACDARTSYAWKMAVYTGKQDGAPEETNQGKRVVLELVEGLEGRTVTCGHFFTSYGLGEELLKKKIAMVGTMRRNKPELPPELLEVRQRDVLSSLFAFSRTHTAVSYVPKRGKNVLLLSTKHREAAVSDEPHRKPLMILDYNRNRGGVDNLDKVVGTYSCRRKTGRWPLKMFHNILDVSAYNAFVLWKSFNPLWKQGSSHKRRLFLEELGKAMVTPLMQHRQRLPRIPSAAAAVSAARGEPEDSDSPPATPGQRRQCRSCSKRIRNVCCRCEQHICRDHTSMLCSTCCAGLSD